MMRQASVNRETSDCPDSAIPSSLEEPGLILQPVAVEVTRGAPGPDLAEPRKMLANGAPERRSQDELPAPQPHDRMAGLLHFVIPSALEIPDPVPILAALDDGVAWQHHP